MSPHKTPQSVFDAHRDDLDDSIHAMCKVHPLLKDTMDECIRRKLPWHEAIKRCLINLSGFSLAQWDRIHQLQALLPMAPATVDGQSSIDLQREQALRESANACNDAKGPNGHDVMAPAEDSTGAEGSESVH